jgi:hypothetical protein
MRPVRTKFRNALPLILVAAAACDGRSSTESIVAPEAPAAGVAGGRGFLSGWSSPRVSDLQPLLETEQRRLSLAETRGRVRYDSVRLDWDGAIEEYRDVAATSAFPVCGPQLWAGTTAIVGPEGGTLNAGPHSLRIPRGALSQYTVVTLEAPASNYLEVRLSPHGLQFLEPPTLVLSYAHCAFAPMAPYRLAFVDGSGDVLELPGSHDDSRNAALLGWIRRISRHAVVQHTVTPSVIRASNYEPKRGYTPAGG